MTRLTRNNPKMTRKCPYLVQLVRDGLVDLKTITDHFNGEDFTLMQHLVETKRSVPFQDWLQEEILAPLGMADSTVQLERQEGTAVGHTAAGAALTGGQHRYQEAAAACVYSTAHDMVILPEPITLTQPRPWHPHPASGYQCKFIMEMNKGAAFGTDLPVVGMAPEGKPPAGGQGIGKVVGDDQVTAMKQRGLGLTWTGSIRERSLEWCHTSSGNGFSTFVKGRAAGNNGYVILTNGDGGEELINEIKEAIGELSVYSFTSGDDYGYW